MNEVRLLVEKPDRSAPEAPFVDLTFSNSSVSAAFNDPDRPLGLPNREPDTVADLALPTRVQNILTKLCRRNFNKEPGQVSAAELAAFFLPAQEQPGHNQIERMHHYWQLGAHTIGEIAGCLCSRGFASFKQVSAMIEPARFFSRQDKAILAAALQKWSASEQL